MNNGFFLTNFNSIHISKKNEKENNPQIKTLNSVPNKEVNIKRPETSVNSELFKDQHIIKDLRKETKKKVHIRFNTSIKSSKTKSKSLQPIVIENILFNNNKNMKDVEEEFKTQNRKLLSQSDELNTLINQKKSQLLSINCQISTSILNYEKLASKEVFDIFKKQIEDIQIKLIEAEKKNNQFKNMEKNLKKEKNRVRAQIVHILNLDSKYDNQEEVYLEIKSDTKFSNKTKKMIQEDLIRHYNENEMINQHLLESKSIYLENLENNVQGLKDTIKDQEEKINQLDILKKQQMIRIKNIEDKNTSIYRDLLFIKHYYMRDYIQYLKLKCFKLPEEFKLFDDNIENVIKMFVTKNIELNGKVSIIGVKNNEMRDKRNDLINLKDELNLLKEKIWLKSKEDDLLPYNQEIRDLEECLKKIKYRHFSFHKIFNEKQNFLYNFIQFLSNSSNKISQILEKRKIFKSLNSAKYLSTISSICEDYNKFKLQKETDDSCFNFTTSLDFNFRLISLFLDSTMKFIQIMLEIDSTNNINFMRIINPQPSENTKVIFIQNFTDKVQIYIDDAIKLKLLTPRNNKKIEEVTHQNIQRKSGLYLGEFISNFKKNLEESQRKKDKFQSLDIEDSYRSENENIGDLKKKRSQKTQRFMDYNLTLELKNFYQRINDLNKLKLLRNKEKNTEKNKKINEIIDNAKNKMSKKLIHSTSSNAIKKINKTKQVKNTNNKSSLFEDGKNRTSKVKSRLKSNADNEEKVMLPQVKSKMKFIKEGFLKGLFSDNFLQETEEEIQKHLKISKSKSELSSMSTLHHSRKTSCSISTINYKKTTFPHYKVLMKKVAENDVI